MLWLFYLTVYPKFEGRCSFVLEPCDAYRSLIHQIVSKICARKESRPTSNLEAVVLFLFYEPLCVTYLIHMTHT